jgi:hypothetical protein
VGSRKNPKAQSKPKPRVSGTGQDHRGSSASKRTAKALGLIEIVRPARKIAINPVPKPLHNKNLRNLIGKHYWRLFKAEIQERREPVCESCGKRFDTFKDLDGHEEWTYHLKPKVSVAKLETILFVCKLCHGAEHILNLFSRQAAGEASEAQLQEVIAHYCRVNEVTRKQFEEDLALAVAHWRALSALTWKVDLGITGEYAAVFVAARQLKGRR